MNLRGQARKAFDQLAREHPTATKEQLFKLFQIVVESDARVRDSLTQSIFDDMKECHRQWETDPSGTLNLTHRFRWFLREGGADAEAGGADGIGCFEEARG